MKEKTLRGLIVENTIRTVLEHRNYSKETLERVLNENFNFKVQVGDIKEVHGYHTSQIYYSDEDNTTKCITLTVKH
jgi:hypothetical protein